MCIAFIGALVTLYTKVLNFGPAAVPDWLLEWNILVSMYTSALFQDSAPDIYIYIYIILFYLVIYEYMYITYYYILYFVFLFPFFPLCQPSHQSQIKF